ncbi:MAG: hypothetical protein LUQ07_04515 [Methanospirillum sp.]|nr:hypothetical protein [Methanospirillum sp.]
MKFAYIAIPMILLLLSAGCTSSNQDEELKNLVNDTISVFVIQNGYLEQPYHGASVSDLTILKSYAEQAKSKAEAMTLSDNGKKARDLYILSLDNTIKAVDTLTADLGPDDTKVETTAPATNYLIQTKSNLDSVAQLLKITT